MQLLWLFYLNNYLNNEFIGTGTLFGVKLEVQEQLGHPKGT